MYRQRLKSKGGCLRCRAARKKCDEALPKCSFCTRWSVNCARPGVSSRHAQDIDVGGNGEGSSQPTNAVDTSVAMLQSLAYAVELPIKGPLDQPRTARYLQASSTGIMEEALPFDVLNARSQVARVLFESVLSDEAACWSFLAFCTLKQFKRSGQVSSLRLSLAFETRTMSLLRLRVHSGESVTNGTIFAAATHFATAIARSTGQVALNVIVAGLKALIATRGGFASLPPPTEHSSRMAVLLYDCLNAIVTVTEPYFERVECPQKPPSLDSLYKVSPCHEALLLCCGTDVIHVFEHLRMMVFFRTPSKRQRASLPPESWYVFTMVSYLSSQLAILQVRYFNSHSFSEVVVLASILLRYEMIMFDAQTPAPISCVRSRLKIAILGLGDQREQEPRIILTWVCLIALMGSGSEDESKWFTKLFFSNLRDRYGAVLSWPQNWELDLSDELHQFIWHERIAKRYAATCLIIKGSKGNATPDDGEWTEAN